MDAEFYLQLWERMLQQSTINLNLLQQSRLHPRRSVYMNLHGELDYNRTPLSPPGTNVVVHNRTGYRASWESHGEHGCYIGPEMEHYR